VGKSVFFDDPERAATDGFLAHLYEDELATVLSYLESRRYAEGEMVVQHGERDRNLYIVTAGRFDVLVPTVRGPRHVRTLERGDIFGDLAFFDEQPRSADIRAPTDAEAFIMTPGGFERLWLTFPRLAMCFVLDLGRGAQHALS
jgi:CRP/FNR family transcriptional regulator, cyclic AMP receptor protein